MQDIVCTWMTKNIGGAIIEKNLEAGRIFYGEKSNLKGDYCGKV